MDDFFKDLCLVRKYSKYLRIILEKTQLTWRITLQYSFALMLFIPTIPGEYIVPSSDGEWIFFFLAIECSDYESWWKFSVRHLDEIFAQIKVRKVRKF